MSSRRQLYYLTSVSPKKYRVVLTVRTQDGDPVRVYEMRGIGILALNGAAKAQALEKTEAAGLRFLAHRHACRIQCPHAVGTSAIWERAQFLTGVISTASGNCVVGGLNRKSRAAGKHYVAVTTANGEGSPRNMPRLVAEDVRGPKSGKGLYVFALRGRR
jgi:hypothetical protein